MAFGILKNQSNYDLVGKIRIFGVISLVLVLASWMCLATLGLNLGIDFAGGYEMQAKFDKPVGEKHIKELLRPLALGNVRVQRFGAQGNNEYLIMLRDQSTLNVQQRESLKKSFVQLAGSADLLTRWSLGQSGEDLYVGFAKPITGVAVRKVLDEHHMKIKKFSVGERQDRPVYHVRLVSVADQVENALRQGLSIPAQTQLIHRVEFVGPQVGKQLRDQGILSLLYALLFILIYIAIRFDFNFAPGAIVAIIHDVSITLGIFSLCRLEFNLPTVAAILALVGYSLNDTIVIYDRIRENLVRLRGTRLRDLVNRSINQTFSRTLLTSGTTLAVVLCLLVFGGGIIRDFSIALFVGMIVGTYSSIYIAAPVYIALRERTSSSTGASRSASDASSKISSKDAA